MATTSAKSTEKEHYYDTLERAAKNISPKKLMRSQWIQMIIQRILTARGLVALEGKEKLPAAVKETLSTYTVLNIDGTNVLVLKGTELESNKIVIALEKSYDMVSQAHELTNHGNVVEMNKCLSQSDYVVSEICLTTITEVCFACHKIEKTETEANSIMPKHLAIIDIMDMSQQKSDEFNYLLIYQDYNSKFVQLRPLTKAMNLKQEICIELIRLFADMGAPDNIKVLKPLITFFTAIVEKINTALNLVIHFSEFNFLDANVNEVATDVQCALVNWIRHNNQCWSIGCFILQWEINSAEDEFGLTPFAKMYGRNPNIPGSKTGEDERMTDENVNLDVSTLVEKEVPAQLHELNLHEDEDLGVFTESDLKEEPDIEDQKIKIEDQIIDTISAVDGEIMSATLAEVDANKTDIDIKTEHQVAPLFEESSEIIIPDRLSDIADTITSTFICCGCKTEITAKVYTCLKCNQCMHLYCGKKVQGNNCWQNICFSCAAQPV